MLTIASQGLPVTWALVATAFFLLVNGFFVAAEFALVKVRMARIEPLAQAGNDRASAVQNIVGRLDHYLSACQLGITIASLVLGWLAEPAVATLLLDLAAGVGLEVQESPVVHFVALAIALGAVTILHMTVGEQAPKIFAIKSPERIALLTALPLRLFAAVFRPLIWVVNLISNALLRLVGTSGAMLHDEEHDINELRLILRASSHAGRITRRQRILGENVLKLVDLQVRHIMLPRVDVVHLSTERTAEENLATVRDYSHSRFPMCVPDLDHVVGLVHGKDVLTAMLDGEPSPDLSQLARSFPSVPDTQPIARLIVDLQRQQAHCALVVDEHGTSVGLAFLEDALEEIVGPLHDEFDEKALWCERISPSILELAGSMPLPEAAELLGIELGVEEDTIAGYVVSVFGRIPSANDHIDILPYRVTVLAMAGRRVSRLRFELLTAEDAPDSVPESTPTPPNSEKS